MKTVCSILASILVTSISFAAKSPEEAKVYADVIQPLLNAKCVSCHGETKQKGKLRLDTAEHTFKGGKGAKADIIVKGNIDDSELTYRVSLPKDDDDVMPPFEGPDTFDPFTKAQQAILNWWVKDGASLDKTVAQAPANVQEEMKKILTTPPKAKVGPKAVMKIIKLPEVPAASAGALATAAKTGVLHLPIHKGTNAISVNALPVQKTFGDKDLAALGSVAAQTLWLNLGKTQISDVGVGNLAKFKELRRLHLDNTKITDKSLATVAKFSHLEYLNLYGTEVTDEGLAHLKGLKNLKKLYLWKTKATPAKAEELKKSIPGIYINIGWENEPAAKVVAVPEGEKPAAKPAPEPINKKCPLTGRDINLNQTVTYKGQVIALCCANCKAKFEKEPEKYISKVPEFKLAK